MTIFGNNDAAVTESALSAPAEPVVPADPRSHDVTGVPESSTPDVAEDAAQFDEFGNELAAAPALTLEEIHVHADRTAERYREVLGEHTAGFSAFLAERCSGPQTPVARHDNFDLRDYSGVFTTKDEPTLHRFLNWAADRRVDQTTVTLLLNDYLATQKGVERQERTRARAEAPIVRDAMRANDRAREAGIAELRQEWGADYARNMAAAQRALNEMPSQWKAQYEKADDDGIHMLNKADSIRKLAKAGLEKGMPLSSSSLDKELADITEFMHKNRRRYNADEKMQARYRALLERKHGNQ